MDFIQVKIVSNFQLLFSIIGALLCLLSYIIRLYIHMYEYKKQSELPKKLFPVSFIIVFFGYLGWGFWSGYDPVKMNISSAVALPVGIAVTVIGFGLFMYAEITKQHTENRSGGLITTGIYSKLRHPMYLGIILFHFGYPFTVKGFTAFVSTFLWIGFILVWRHYEEKNLERKYGERYREYKNQTWF